MRPIKLTMYDKDDDDPVPSIRLVRVSTRAELIVEMLKVIDGQHRICHAEPV